MENMRGAALMVFAMICFAVEDMFVKKLTAGLPVGEVLTILGFGGGLIFSVAALARGDGLLTRTALAPLVLLRNAGEITGTMAFVFAIAYTPLALASAIIQATPLAVTLGAALWLKEPVGWRRWAAILVGFAGVLIVIRPGTAGFDPWSVLSVISVIGLAVRDLATRRAPRTITTMQLSAYGFLTLVPTGLILNALTGAQMLAPDAAQWMWFFFAMLLGVMGYYALNVAMRIGETSVITPFRYTRLLCAIIIAAVVFDEAADQWTLIGGAVIVLSGVYMLAREARAKRRVALETARETGQPTAL